MQTDTMAQNLFVVLLDKFLLETLTAKEWDLFTEQCKKAENQRLLQEIVLKKIENKTYQGLSDKNRIEEMFRQVMQKAEEKEEDRATEIIQLNSKRSPFIFRRIAAAVVAVLLLATGYWLFFDSNTKINKTVAEEVREQPATRDLPPGKDAAILTFDDGKQIILDSTTGTISRLDGTTIINMNGLLTYSSAEDKAKPAYHTITTARGNQYQLVLADGSKVFLNSASSLRFPSSFTGSLREVELTSGEAYFDIAKNAAVPFHVKTREMTVKVSGTHFNVNAYSEEGPVATTLVEGRVSVTAGQQSVSIKPGQQAVFVNNDFSILHPDINKVIAWTNGFFEFDNMDIHAIMRQVSRWYDVDIIYEGKVTKEKFGGRISKHLPLSKVLKLLEENDVKFRLEGKRLVVKS